LAAPDQKEGGKEQDLCAAQHFYLVVTQRREVVLTPQAPLPVDGLWRAPDAKPSLGDPFMRLFALLMPALLLAVFAACASDNGSEKPTDEITNLPEESGAQAIDVGDQFDSTGLDKRRLDLNRDGKADAYQWLKIVDAEDIQVRRKEVDVNFDGKIDVVRNFTKKGGLVTEHMDTDFDGRIDVVNVFEDGVIVRKEYDTNFDHAVDVWRYFENNVIVRKERDDDYDGKVDYWEYYEDGQIDRIGIDNDGDGAADEWQRNNASPS
jgi:hypothetical protein